MLRIGCTCPAAVAQAVRLQCCRTDVRAADIAVLLDAVLGVGVFRILRGGAMPAVIVFAGSAAVTAGTVAAVLRGRIIRPCAVIVAAMGRAPVDGFAAVSADTLPVAAVPDGLRAAVGAGCRPCIAAKRADAVGIEAVRAGVAVGVLIRRAVVAGFPDVMAGRILRLIFIAPGAGRAGAAVDAAVAARCHKKKCRSGRKAFCCQSVFGHIVLGGDDKLCCVHTGESGVRDLKCFVMIVKLQGLQLTAVLEGVLAEIRERRQDAAFQLRAAGEPVGSVGNDHMGRGIEANSGDLFSASRPGLIVRRCKRRDNAAAGNGQQAAFIQLPQKSAFAFRKCCRNHRKAQNQHQQKRCQFFDILHAIIIITIKGKAKRII